MNGQTRRQSGFTLIELLIAMVVTLIIGGAVVGLLLSANRAFRREPAVTERQQNIRAAMDMIMRDVGNAGAGMMTWTQVFTTGLNGACGLLCADGPPPEGPFGLVTDELELLTNAAGMDPEPTCSDPGKGSGNVRLVRGSSQIPDGAIVIILMAEPPGTYSIRHVTKKDPNNNGADNCTAGVDHEQLSFNSGGDPINPPGGICDVNLLNQGTVPAGEDCTAGAIVFADLVRYRIRKDAEDVPVLQRISSMEGLVPQVVARGVEELQVRYRSPANLPETVTDGTSWTDVPAGVTQPSYDTLTVEVEVTLWARAETTEIEGATVIGDEARAHRRGALVSRGSPRSILYQLATDLTVDRWQ